MARKNQTRTRPAHAVQQHTTITEISAAAETLQSQGDLPGAIRTYRDWLKRSNSPLNWVAHFNLGILLKSAGDYPGAEAAYLAAIRQNPDFAQARINLGLIHELMDRTDDAINDWRSAIEYLDKSPNPDSGLLCIALNNLGRRLEIQNRYVEASAALTRSLTLQPRQESVLYHWLYLRQRQCEWPIYGPLPGLTAEDMAHATSALAMLALSDDPEVQLQAARRHQPVKHPESLAKLAPTAGYDHDRFRIGYLSSNFGMHPVSFLTAELYELHDRSRFEVYGFCWSPEDGSELRERVKSAMDHFIRIDQMTDEEAARTIRNAEIDILIDLQGLTAGARPTILAHRPAPIQITYLGFPGTTGLPEVDYVIADRYVIPEDQARFFSEKPIYMPDCYQVNDRKRIVAPFKSRAEYGLPDDAFVFCAFNKNTKLNPEFFNAWMRILNRTPGSVLWLLADNDTARANLESQARRHGVDSARLIFAPRVPLPDYLARYAAADLFLDLSPFNGGTTAADALWVGLPVLTCSGRSFASRMAGSLLNAIGLPELVTHTLQDYENLAIKMATDERHRLGELRDRIKKNRDTTPLFDSPRFTRNFENAITKLIAEKPKMQAHARSGGPLAAQSAAPTVGEVAAQSVPSPAHAPRPHFSEHDIYFVVCSPPYQRTSGGIHALHCLAEDMYAMGCAVGMLAATSMPGARVPLITPERLQEIRSSGVLIVAIYPEIVVENFLQADFVVWWLLNYPGFIKKNWDGNADWADRIVGFPDAAKYCRCDSTLIYPLYDTDFFFPNQDVPKTEIVYYVNRILGTAPDSRPPIKPTRVLSPNDKLSYKQLRNLFWKTQVIMSHEWSGTFTIAQLCGVPVIFLESPIFSPTTHAGGAFVNGSAWGYSEENIQRATESLGEVTKTHLKLKSSWTNQLEREIRIWIEMAKRKP